MRTMAHDELEEAQSFVRIVDGQIGDIRHTLTTDGLPLYSDDLVTLDRSSPKADSSGSSDTDSDM